MTPKRLFSIPFIGIIFFNSCTMYYIPVDSFKQEFMGMDSSSLKKVEVQGGGFPIIKEVYLSNAIGVIHCMDKNGNLFSLNNRPSIEIRFTYGHNNKRTTFYFDQIFVTHSTVTGVQSRIIPSIRKTISLDSITKIEVQDGKKNYHYINNPSTK